MKSDIEWFNLLIESDWPDSRLITQSEIKDIQNDARNPIESAQPAPENIHLGQRVRLKIGDYAGTISGNAGRWYSIKFDDGKRPHVCNCYGHWEFELIPE